MEMNMRSSSSASRLDLDGMKKENPHIGSPLDDFLKEEGVLEETRALALKQTLA
jgi:hypothetical protein